MKKMKNIEKIVVNLTCERCGSKTDVLTLINNKEEYNLFASPCQTCCKEMFIKGFEEGQKIK